MVSDVHAVGLILENEMGEILVFRRNPNDPEGKMLGLVGGKIEGKENIKETVIREVLEETGIDLSSFKLNFLKTYTWNWTDLNLIFDVFKLVIPKNKVNINSLDRKENTEFFWKQPKELIKRPDLMRGLYPILKDEYKL